MAKVIFIIFYIQILVYIGCYAMPEMLTKCYNGRSKFDNKLATNKKCLEEYLFHVFGDKFNHVFDKDALNWIDSLGRKFYNRVKRETTGKRRVRVRKELRTLSHTERNTFFNALNALKEDTSVKPNKYDAIALFHQGDALKSAHGGPNFPAWHRYYLYILEEALRTKNGHITLPYWDSRIDYRMPDPTKSILWTELFLGNGKGVVYTGPFALWITPSNKTYLRRDIGGQRSSLMDAVKLENVFKQRYNREIFSPTSKNDLDNLEKHHNAVHRWVGGKDGHMSGLATSAMDPVFFLHHCFVDYLWEKFREQQREHKIHKINPETDYPAGPRTNQQPNRTMANLLPNRTSIWGYSNYFTDNVYGYADAPTCQNSCSRGHSVFLYCNKTIDACESRSRRHFEESKSFSSIPLDSVHYHPEHTSFSEPGGEFTFSPPMNLLLTATYPPPDLPEIFPHSILDHRTIK